MCYAIYELRRGDTYVRISDTFTDYNVACRTADRLRSTRYGRCYVVRAA